MPAGRPPIIASPEEMDEKIQEYFDSLRHEDKDGITHWDTPTMSGLALALGFVSRQSLADYEARDGYSYSIKRARLLIKDYWEKKLAGTAPTGAIFWLKNHDDYRDKQEVEATGSGLVITVKQDVEGV